MAWDDEYRMKGRLRRLGIVAGSALVVALVLVIGVRLLVDSAPVRARIAAAVAEAVGRPVELSALSIGVLLGPVLTVEDLAIGEDAAFGRGPFFTLREAAVALRLWPLLSGRAEVSTIRLREPRLVIVEAAGQLNVSSLGNRHRPSTPKAGGAAAVLSGARIEVDDGLVSYVRQDPSGAAQSYRLEGLTLVATSGTAMVLEANAVLHPGAVQLHLVDARIGFDAATVREAAVEARLEIDARDVRELMGRAGRRIVGCQRERDECIGGHRHARGAAGSRRPDGGTGVSHVQRRWLPRRPRTHPDHPVAECERRVAPRSPRWRTDHAAAR